VALSQCMAAYLGTGFGRNTAAPEARNDDTDADTDAAAAVTSPALPHSSRHGQCTAPTTKPTATAPLLLRPQRHNKR
jgi:hypothetical protein